VHTFNIPAGPLEGALNRFGKETGILLSFSPETTSGLRSPGLRGTFNVQEGLATVLSGTGVQALPQPNGNILLRRQPVTSTPEMTSATSTLSEVRVVGSRIADGTTEGTGSYTAAGPSSMSAGLGLTLRETPQSLTVVTRQKLDDFNLNTLTDVIDQTPGVFAHKQGSVVEFFSRGEQVQNFQVNGLRQTNGSGQSPQGLYVNDDMATIDRVEVLKGSAGLLQGDGNPSATINLIRKKPTREFQAYVAAGAGSWNAYRTEADVSGPLNESGSVRGRVVAAYSDTDTYRLDEKSKGGLVFGTLDVDLDRDTLLNIEVDYRKRQQYGTPGSYSFQRYGMWGEVHESPSRSWNAAAPWAGGNLYSLSTHARLEHRFANDWVATLRVGVDSRREPESWYGYAGSSTYYSQGTSNNVLEETKNLAVDVKGPFDLLGRRHELVAGYNWTRANSAYDLFYAGDFIGTAEYQNYLATTDYAVDGNRYMPQADRSYLSYFSGLRTRSTQSGAYVAARFSLTDDLTLLTGARVSAYKSRTDNLNASRMLDNQTGFDESSVITPYAGLVYDLNRNLSLYGSYTSVFQPVTLQDEKGQTLDPKEGVTYEIGTKGEFFDGRLNASIAQFWKRWEKASELSGGLTPLGTPAYRNIDNVMEHGYELELSGELARGWQAQGSYVMNNSEINASRLPKQQFKLSTSYDFSGDLRGLTIGAAARWQSHTQTRTESPNIAQSSYWVFDIMSRYRVNKHWSASVNVNNLLDRKYLYVYNWAPAYLGQYQSWGAPRSVNLTVRYQF